MATPEKALLDFIYFEIPYKKILDRGLYEESYRLASFAQLDIRILKAYVEKFRSPKLSKVLPLLLALIEEDKRD